MENEGAILSRDHSLISNSHCGKIPLDDALAASFMSHFAPDQGCSTTIPSQTLVHSQLVRTFLCRCSAHDLAQMHFHLQSYVDYFIKPYSRGWYLLSLIDRMCKYGNPVRVSKGVTWNSVKGMFQVEMKRVYQQSKQGHRGILRVGSRLAFKRPAERGLYKEPSYLFPCIEHFDEDNGILVSQFEECRKNTIACFDNVFP